MKYTQEQKDYLKRTGKLRLQSGYIIGVFNYNTDEKISEFATLIECSIDMNISTKSISQSCRNIKPCIKGFRFKYI